VNSGAGLTAVATHHLNLSALHSRIPEAMFIDWHDAKLADLIKNMDVVVCGSGLGMSDFAKQILVILRRCTSEKQTVILDAS
ncbi:NAD(P)H-hydrate dehydratase, partial [Bacillus thuringiensis]